MGQQVRRPFSSRATTERGVSTGLRIRLAATTILAVAPFLGYGRQAYADCLLATSPSFTCSGTTNATQNITTDDADVTTAPGFNLTTPAGNGINIQANGHLQFTDENASPITATNGTGLSVYSTGNSASNAGAITIVTNGDITGGDGDGIFARSISQTGGPLTINTEAGSAITGSASGIVARNYGGDLAVTADGEVTGESEDGINVLNAGIYDPTGNSRNLTITTGADSVIRGYDDGIIAVNRGTGDLVITANGEVTGYGLDPTAGYGINAFNSPNGGDLRITTGADSVIYGRDGGIDVENNGDGDLIMEINGQVTSNDNAIDAVNDEGVNTAITIGADSVVTGGTEGITASNRGAGNFDITVDGEVTGSGGDAIFATSFGEDLTLGTGAASAITGNSDGIDARNYGSGDLTFTVDGEVTGQDGNGLYAVNDGYDGLGNAQNLTITTGTASVISGGDYGIRALNRGDGNLTITANGEVEGGDDGIYAANAYYDDYNGARIGFGVDLTVTTGAQSTITGGEDGIDARNFGSGLLKVDANGEVTGNDGDGVRAFALDGDVEVKTGAGSSVTGLDGDGIGAFASNSGSVVVKALGAVSGSAQGIDAEAVGDGGTVLIETAASVTGGSEGIDASANSDVTVKTGGDVGGGSTGINAFASSGDILVTTAAGTTVSGTSSRGIDAVVSTAGNIVIEAESAVTGRNTGIDAYTYAGTIDITTGGGAVTGTNDYGIEATASGKVTITTQGDVTGAVAGIHATTALGDTEDAIRITNNGTVANLSGEGDALAITASGGAATIDNNARLVGTVVTDSSDDVLDNAGFWNMAGGTSSFGDGHDEVTNSGTFLAADDPANDENTFINYLDEFTNSGLVSLVDGQAGDDLFLVDGANYTGAGGRLAVDAVLGPDSAGGLSDRLFVLGEGAGKTLVHVNVVGATGINTEGIPVVFAGGPEEAQFDLDGPLYVGFFSWDLRLDDGGGLFHELYTSGVGAGSYEFAAGITAAQEIWQQTMGTLLQRQADLRSLLGGTGVTPAADFAQPVDPTPVANVTPGFWLRGVGAYVERDDEQNGIVLDRRQTIWGGLAGFDFGTEDVGDALMFGVFGGYLTSDLDFDQTNTEWTYDGPTVGAYVTYVNQSFYADATVKVDFLDVDIDANDLMPADNDADTDVLNIGGRIDTGYKIGFAGGMFAEPQAAIAVVHTEIDDVDIFGGAVEFDDETNVKGRIGLRLGNETTASDGIVYSGDVTASVWEDFSGDNDVAIAFPGIPSFGVSDDPGATLGDVSLGFSVANPEGWSAFLRANYLFAEDYEAVTGNAGVRWAW